jgi:hypothetical protein
MCGSIEARFVSKAKNGGSRYIKKSVFIENGVSGKYGARGENSVAQVLLRRALTTVR